MVDRILQQNHVRKWLIRYHKWLERSDYIRWSWKAGSSGLQSIDLIEDISPLVTEHDESESFLPATIKNSEWEQSDKEDDVDFGRNIFDDIIIDDEWIDNPDSTL